MFLPFGRNSGIGIGEMLSLCVEKIPKINGVSTNCSTVPMLMLVVAPSNTAKKKKYRSSKDVCRSIPKNNLSPQMMKRPLATIVHKYLQSHQSVKIDHVDNGQEGQSEPS